MWMKVPRDPGRDWRWLGEDGSLFFVPGVSDLSLSDFAASEGNTFQPQKPNYPQAGGSYPQREMTSLTV